MREGRISLQIARLVDIKLYIKLSDISVTNNSAKKRTREAPFSMVSCPLIESHHYIFYNPPAKFSSLMFHSLSKLPLALPSLTFVQLSRVQEMLLAATAMPPLGHLARMPPPLGWKKVLSPSYRDLCASIRHITKFSCSIRVRFGFEEGRFQG